MTTNAIRSKFLNFFKSKGHALVLSDSLVPKDDPTVLFTTAGMQQFKSQFLGREVTYRRAVTCQKCLRTDDLDCVGETDFHHTFFEMLGNFSFGDYFKKEAISWAWEFLTQEMKLPKERLWISVYKEDDEAYGIWLNDIKIPAGRIVKLGDKSNFWPSNARRNGPNGPCGPCSEIFYDTGVNACPKGTACDPDCSCGRFSEIWNLVFTQFNRQDPSPGSEFGVLEALPGKNIDTGMGLERLAGVVQGKKSNYETSAFALIIQEINQAIPGIREKDARIMADHVRAVVMGIADGVVPSNEGRGYVIRKLIVDTTDLAVAGRAPQPIVFTLVDAVVGVMAEPYPELLGKSDEIKAMVKRVEEAFIKVRRERVPELEERILKVHNDPHALGDAFFLFRDTHGLTLSTITGVATRLAVNQDILNQALKIFDRKMEEQKNRSRAGSKMGGDVFSDTGFKLEVPKTEFVGYVQTQSSAKVLKIIHEVDGVKVILNKTPFYAQSGGQVGDAGLIRSSNGLVRVTDTQKINDIYVHLAQVEQGHLREGEEVSAEVDTARRNLIARNHTATHLLQAALREVLGGHIKQQGSLVAPERLRFDFTHPAAVKAQDLERIEAVVIGHIRGADPLTTEVLPLELARKKGALAFFAEKYGQTVRVISIGAYSKEFCGGTHVQTTAQIEAFKIVSEGSVAQGIRRLEAVTGHEAVNALLKERQKEERIKEQALLLRQQEKGEQNQRFEALKSSADAIISKAENIKGARVIISALDGIDMDMLRKLSELLRQKFSNSLFVLGSANQTDAAIVIAVNDDLVNRGIKADELLKVIAPLMDASGGGRAHLAQAGGKSPGKLEQALKQAREIVNAVL